MVDIEVRFPHRNFVFDVGQRRVHIDIHMPRAGKVMLRTGDGRISVNHLKGEMDLYSGDGRLEVEDVDGNLRARTGDGHITVNVPVTVEGQRDRQDIHGKLNGGGNRLVVRTGDGSITVDKS